VSVLRELTGGTGSDRWSTRWRHGPGAYRHRRRRAGCSSRSMAIGTVAWRASQPGLQRRVEVWLAAVRGTRASRGVRTRKGSTWRQAPALMAAARARSRMGSSSAATTAVHTAATRATNTRASAATPAAEAPDRSTRRRDETIRMSRRLSPWPGEQGSGQLNGQPLWPWSACSNVSPSPSTGRRCWPPYGRSTHHILRGSPRRRRRGNGSISGTVELRTPRSAPIRPPACRAATGERDPMIMGWSRHSRSRVPAKRSAIASTVRAGAGAGVMGAALGAAG
jgi:hypothetical protein